MAAEWYYLVDGRQQGPVELERLARWAEEDRILPGDMVWRSGMPGWVRADTVQGLNFPPPRRRGGGRDRDRDRPRPSEGEFSTQELRDIAARQRELVWYMLVAFVFNCTATAFAVSAEQPLNPLVGLLALIFLVIQITMISRLALALRQGLALIAFIPLSLIPLINLICLLVVNQMATGALVRQGIPVGFMGTDPGTIRDDD